MNFMGDTQQKPMTIEDLATMVAGGFNDVISRMDRVEGEVGEIKAEMKETKGEVRVVKEEISHLNHKIEALNSNVTNYLELSEKRYFELKQRDAHLAKWIKLIAEKTNVPIDVSQLEKI